MAPSRPLVLEALEDRCVPVVWGNPWPDGTHLTFSFVPDGTADGNGTSQLFQTLNAQIGPGWQREVLRAFQTWAANANIDLGVIGDGGQALGIAGRPQGDSRFGDIRVGARPMVNALALTTPFDSSAGTWSGDVNLNSSAHFNIGGGSAYDLFTVLLHEAGHSFGLADSSYTRSVMYEDYSGVSTGLSASDIAQIQALYGARAPDAYEGSTGNNTFATATSLTLLQNLDLTLTTSVNADVTTLGDADYYAFRAPLALGMTTVSLQTSGLSLLNARVTVYDANHRVVAGAVATDPLHGDLTLNLSQLGLGKQYFIKVESGTQDVFGIGSYHLQIRTIPLVSSLLGTTLGVVGGLTNTLSNLLTTNDFHTNDTPQTATPLASSANASSPAFTYSYLGNIEDKTDVDYYRAHSPAAVAGAPSALTVMVWGLQNNGLIPKANVYDANGNLVSAQVLVNENGIYTLQIANAAANTDYLVKVQAVDPNSASGVGGYFLGMNFQSPVVPLQTLASGQLDAATGPQSGVLTLTHSELYHFVLEAATANPAPNAKVTLTILDSNGNLVGSLTAPNGTTVSLTLLLGPGTYTFLLTGNTSDGSPPPPINFVLKSYRLTDPIGPQPDDPTMDPSSGQTDPGSNQTNPGPTTGKNPPPTSPPPSTNDSWYWYGVNSSDPYSDPYSPA